MAMTQMQIIQSLGEAMAWFERERTWGVPATELRHLVGRIGELYAALVTNGQMASKVNQKGYDVVSGAGERVSVKTTAMMGASGHISFNVKTLDVVERVLVLRVNTEEMQIETLLDAPTATVIDLMGAPNDKGRAALALSKLLGSARPIGREIPVVRTARLGVHEVVELENGTIEVHVDGEVVRPTMPALRKLAGRLGVGLLNGNGNPYNTRQLGSLLVDVIEQRQPAMAGG